MGRTKNEKSGSNVGQIAKEQGIKLTQNGMGKFFRLAGIGGHVSGMIEFLRKKNRSERKEVEARDNRDNYRRNPASGDRSVHVTVDTTPPTISNVSASVDANGRVTVQATVTDDGTGVKSVNCSYQGPGDWVRESFDMIAQGGGVYRGTSKVYTQSGTFNYAVEARDNRDNYSRDPASGMIESTKAEFKLSRT